MDEMPAGFVDAWETERNVVKRALNELLRRSGDNPDFADATRRIQLESDIARLDALIASATGE